MLSQHNIARFVGAHVTDPDGAKIGTVGQIYVDPSSGRPNWATVKTGLFGTSESFVPLDGAEDVDGDLRVPFTKDVVKGAPRIDSGGELSDGDEDRLYDYYEGSDTEGRDESGRQPDRQSDVQSDDGSAAPDRGVQEARVETGRVRLRKYVVTEQRTVTVPVTREEVRLEREPLTDTDTGTGTDAAGPDGHDTTGADRPSDV
jgi:sporulation protein YlmC with PRC-barrel domain